MNRSVFAVVLLLLVAALLPALPAVRAQGSPQVAVNSQYVVNRYGYAIVNETVKLTNNGSAAVLVPDMQFGFGNVSSLITNFNVTGTGYSVSRSTGSQGEVYTVSGGGQSLGANANSTFSFKALVNGIASKTANGTLGLLLVTRPYLSFDANSLKLLIKMPGSTQFRGSIPDYKLTISGVNNTYSQTLTNTTPQPAQTQTALIQANPSQDFHPLVVYSASRQVTISSSGSPLVRDSVFFKNLGTTQLQTLTVAPLTSSNGQITVLPSSTPPLLSPVGVLLSNRGIDLTNSAVGLPVDAGANLTITYQYALAQKYYSVSGGVVSIQMPLTPPIAAFVNSYSIGLSLPPGVKAVEGASQASSNVGPFQSGTARLSYGFSVGWGLDTGVPFASFLFVLVLVGLFAARTRMAPEEEKEEESATERASDMIKAFEEKTSLINGLFEEIPTVEANEVSKAYFDELRGRLDTFRSRALQRLNEVKQKSTTQRFFDFLGQIHETEREVDRAAKDMLNLYEQFYTKRMREEVFDRLLPNYRKRLEKALNQLSDELNTAQREAKLL
ncbi:MAG: hypothetical protein LYZ66_05710 [Nitrososphaerales archaeon]|nr:hypothetical protein [Nitrososphaerales archaeon]